LTDEECCAPISYVYGGVSLSPKPPGHFVVGARVVVGTQVAPLIGPEMGHDHALWHYLVVIKPGPTKVVCSVGDVTSTKIVETKAGETSIVNFCFGKPVVSSSPSGITKLRVRRREQEKPPTGVPTGKSGVEAVS